MRPARHLYRGSLLVIQPCEASMLSARGSIQPVNEYAELTIYTTDNTRMKNNSLKYYNYLTVISSLSATKTTQMQAIYGGTRKIKYTVCNITGRTV